MQREQGSARSAWASRSRVSVGAMRDVPMMNEAISVVVEATNDDKTCNVPPLRQPPVQQPLVQLPLGQQPPVQRPPVQQPPVLQPPGQLPPPPAQQPSLERELQEQSAAPKRESQPVRAAVLPVTVGPFAKASGLGLSPALLAA